MTLAGLALACSISGCALLPAERGKAPVGANLERLAATEPGRRDQRILQGTPIEPGARILVGRPAGAGS